MRRKSFKLWMQSVPICAFYFLMLYLSITNWKSYTLSKQSLESCPSLMLCNLEVSLPCLDFVISIKYLLNITYIPMVIWYQEVTFQLICTSNTVEITCLISFIWIINRWASEELGCELQFLKPGFNYH